MARRLRTPLALAIFGLVATALNLTKAVHIDDTAYLEISRHIRTDPLHPFSGTLNWRTRAEPIYRTNQPPLLFYQYALVLGVLGESELALHLLMAIWSSTAIVFFHGLARRLGCVHPLCLTAMFCLSPAFLPSQNLMTDVPTVALWLIFFWSLSGPKGKAPEGNALLIAAVACAAACLTKYVSLVLLPILLLAVVLHRSFRKMWVLGIPLAALAAWSLLNLFDYGEVHLLSRGSSSLNLPVLPRRFAEWLICLGAVSPFSLMLLACGWSKRTGVVLLIFSASVAAATFVISRNIWANTDFESLLKAAFMANGVFLLAAASVCLARECREPKCFTPSQTLLLAAWLLGALGMVVFFSPGMAVRHVLPAMPAFLLIGGKPALGPKRRGWIDAATAVTVVSGILFGISDWQYADVYRKEAPRLHARFSRESHTLWHVGHWGWQWYADRAGMKPYDPQTAQPERGDRIVVPRLTDKQPLAHKHLQHLKHVEQYVVPSSPETLLRVMAIGPRGGYGYYAFRIETLPWTCSTAPIEYFDVFEWVDAPQSKP